MNLSAKLAFYLTVNKLAMDKIIMRFDIEEIIPPRSMILDPIDLYEQQKRMERRQRFVNMIAAEFVHSLTEALYKAANLMPTLNKGVRAYNKYLTSLMIVDRLAGISYGKIAKKYKLNKNNVRRRIVRVSQSVEERVLNTLKCQFEPDHGHQILKE